MTSQNPTAGTDRATLVAALKEKGWSIRDAAEYLGVSRQRIYSAFADPFRARLWECAISGLPKCTKAMAKSLKEARKARIPVQRKSTGSAPPEFEINDGVASVAHSDFCADGQEGWIADIVRDRQGTRLLIHTQQSQFWLSVKEFREYFVTNGKTRPQRS